MTKVKRKFQSSGEESSLDEDIIEKLNVDTNCSVQKNKERKRLGKVAKKAKKQKGYIANLSEQLSTSLISETN